ncbi:MAG TPA: VOC family protein [Acidimicrobiales bacterium]|nr:VOC family protein [Acidimicrobiales bacterium]
MTSRLVSLTFDATDPTRLARFWASALGWEIVDESGDVALRAPSAIAIHPSPALG